MQQYLITVVVIVAVVVVITGIGVIYSRRLMANARDRDVTGGVPAQGQPGAAPAAASAPEPAPDLPQIYERSDVDQQSDHPLGAVQSVIRGRIRFLPYGLVTIAAMLLGLWMLYFTNRLAEYTTSSLAKLAATALMAAGIIYGLRVISYVTYRVKLRRSGFEISSIFGTKAYDYQDADFYLTQDIEHFSEGGYRQAFWSTWRFNLIWVCQIQLKEEHKLLTLKSSRYSQLKSKIQMLQASLTVIDH
ncbi:MAG: hypothetical protein FWD65_02340 [Coriobacteriia bacterium]|nr:hypothetical protein [Coriobacteriia bacterium]